MLKDQLKQIRSSKRLSATTVITALTTDFFALHGDGYQGDDPAVTVGFGRFMRQTVLMIGVNRGATIQQRLAYHFGAVSPAGYRKVNRGLKQAAKFHWPVISLINMPGAAADVAAERTGQSQAIAATIRQMGQLPVPNIAVFLGEGQSGGALALANCNRILMLENSLYSVASPEAVQAILKNRRQELTAYLPMTAPQLLKLGLADQVITEDQHTVQRLQRALTAQLTELQTWSPAKLKQQRQAKYLALVAPSD